MSFSFKTCIHNYFAWQSKAVTFDATGTGHSGPGLSRRLVRRMHKCTCTIAKASIKSTTIMRIGPTQPKWQPSPETADLKIFGHSNALQFCTLRFTCMMLASVSMAQQPVVPADPFPSHFLIYILVTKYKHGTTGCPAGPGPCAHISSAACANFGPVADYERPVALS